MSLSTHQPEILRRMAMVLPFAAILLTGAIVTDSHAQIIDVTELSDDGTTRVLQFDVRWPLSLAQSVDSVDADVWSWNEVQAVTRGITHVSETIDLYRLEMPRVTVLGRSFDEAPVPVSDAAGLADSPDAEAVGLGWYRKRPVVELSVQLARLDAGAGLIRRLNSITVAVERTRGAGPVDGLAKTDTGPGNPHLAIDRSALADGQIVRMRFTEEGIYRVDRAWLQTVGLDPDTIDPDDIHILGNGGEPLPALNSAFRYADVVENPVVRSGGGDGRFDAGDAVIFYAAAPRGWRLAGAAWEHYVHPYSNYNTYFLKVGSGGALTAAVEPVPPSSGAPNRTTTLGRFVLDVEEQVWSREHGSGTDWVSNQIRGGSTRTFLDGERPPGFTGGRVEFETRFAIASNPRATVVFEAGASVLGQLTSPRTTFEDPALPSAYPSTLTFEHDYSGQNGIDLTMRLIDSANEPEAALDYVRAFYEQDLRAESGYLRFATSPGLSGTQVYVLAGFQSRPTVLDVTRPDDIRRLETIQAGGNWTIGIAGETLESGAREIVAFTSGAAQPPPDQTASVPNQDLHGTDVMPDLVIVVPDEFRSAADRLADHRRSEGLVVQVETVERITNEFAGGVPDMRAVRDFLKMLYDRSTSEETLLRYVLLLGDGHYDFRDLSARQGELENWIFPFETAESMFTDGTYSSDDYFGLLDDSEGEWEYVNFRVESDERVDIGIGRFPVQTAAEADMLVDKVMRYDNAESFGAWRSRYTFVADDDLTGLSGQQNDRDLHLANVDQVADLLSESLYPRINQTKIYGQSYEREFLNGFRIPGARRDILDSIEEGTLVMNYSGHGGPDALAQEEIFTLEDAAALTNGDRMPIFVTATCSFGWWDLEESQSGAEVLLLNPNGGAVALLTTVRLVYTSGDTTSLNAGLNRALNINMFRMDDEGLPRRLGDILRDTKNTDVGLQGNSRKFNLLGDPSMRIGLAPRNASVDKLSSIDLETTAGQMKALDRVTVEGTIRDPMGNVATDFDGDVSVTVFDAERRVPKDYAYWSSKTFFSLREDLIWRGSARATAGRFTAEFIVPKDISYSDEPGRISVYASNASTHALGFTENFNVGGTSDNPPNDGVGPDISLFLNDTTFVSGSTVPADPELIVRLFDDSGINTVGAGVGHEMLLVVDGDESSAQDIAGAFTAEQNSFRRGEVRWTLNDLTPGEHALSVRAWDVLNNSNESSLEFFISDDEVLGLANVYNYPNPMSRETRFVFDHNQPAGTPARVQVRIYTLNGRPIRTIETEEALPQGVLPAGPVQVNWNGLDDDLDRPATGIYLYRVRVEVDRSDGTTRVSEHVEKLAYIR